MQDGNALLAETGPTWSQKRIAKLAATLAVQARKGDVDAACWLFELVSCETIEEQRRYIAKQQTGMHETDAKLAYWHQHNQQVTESADRSVQEAEKGLVRSPLWFGDQDTELATFYAPGESCGLHGGSAFRI